MNIRSIFLVFLLGLIGLVSLFFLSGFYVVNPGYTALHLRLGRVVAVHEKSGYKIVAGGKGSHIKLKKKNCPTVIIPNHKELSTGLEHALMKLLRANN